MAIPQLPYHLDRVINRRIAKFGIEGTEYRLTVGDVPPDLHYLIVVDMVHDLLDRVLQELLLDGEGNPRYPDHHRVRFTLRSEGLQHEIWIPFTPPSQLTVDRIMLSVEKVLQSDQQWLLSGPLHLLFVHAPLPSGSRGLSSSRIPSRTSDFLRLKRSIIQIPVDEDAMCCARALVVALAYVDNHPRYNSLVKSKNCELQVRLARVLLRKAGLDERQPCGYPEWCVLQRVIGSRYSLVIVCRDLFDQIVYYGNPSASKVVSLFNIDDHYHVITRLPAFFGVGYVCPHCTALSRSKVFHRCSQTCYYCRAPGQCQIDDKVLCSRCNIGYPSRECFERHLSEGFCEKRSRCVDCGKIYTRDKGHKCGQRLCPRCKTLQPEAHRCYMQPLAPNPKESQRRPYIFYDFECMTMSDGQHVPNLCVVHRVCTLCMHLPMADDISCVCNRERLIFEGVNTLRDFGEYLFNGRRKGAICMAHNSGGYDGHFLLSFIHDRGMKPELLLRGRKILSIDVRGIRFIDSLNFFPMSLAKLPRAFGLTELRKGFFPHFFNIESSWDYRGPLPPRHYYGPDQMVPSRREEFLTWYDEQAGKEFNFYEELVSYCISDVDILQRCCGVFRKLFVEYTGLEPFTTSVTIASACNRVYRSSYLAPREIALIPPEGFFKGKQSAIALCWLEGLTLQNSALRIAHYGNRGEQTVKGRMVDGVDEDGTLYFFHGCFWHSCIKCYPNERDSNHPVKHVTHRENYEQTEAFMASLRASGRVVVEMWECTYRPSMTAQDKRRLEKWHVYEPLKPRDAFYGGRCNASTLYVKAKGDDLVKYVDFTSLYPYVNKYARYPIHHPEVYTGSDIPERVEGLLKCKVLPPTSLYHPVLPYRCRGKLLFPLCRTCAESCSRRACDHTSADDRALTGTWVTCELERACELGYRILERFEAWHFPHTSQYNPLSKEGGIWADFISKWVGLKQEASGYPPEAQTDAQKRAYVENYERQEGIKLDPSRIEKNEGLRSLAKLMCNSHWGKSAQQSNKTQVTYVSDVKVYVRMMSDPTIAVQDVYHISGTYIAILWSREKEFDRGLPNTNVVLAAYTTANARLRLYDLLHNLQDRALYFDTDSVIYLHKNQGQYNPTLDCYLGGLKDELPNDVISEYCALGPKNYALKLSGGRSICKVRGFSLNYRTSQLINYDTLSQMVLCGALDRTIETCDPHAIVREREVGVVRTAPKVKRYRMVYDKRMILEDGVHTLPFGWKGPHPQWCDVT